MNLICDLVERELHPIRKTYYKIMSDFINTKLAHHIKDINAGNIVQESKLVLQTINNLLNHHFLTLEFKLATGKYKQANEMSKTMKEYLDSQKSVLYIHTKTIRDLKQENCELTSILVCIHEIYDAMSAVTSNNKKLDSKESKELINTIILVNS